jgi:hypothetical protein
VHEHSVAIMYVTKHRFLAACRDLGACMGTVSGDYSSVSRCVIIGLVHHSMSTLAHHVLSRRVSCMIGAISNWPIWKSKNQTTQIRVFGHAAC